MSSHEESSDDGAVVAQEIRPEKTQRRAAVKPTRHLTPPPIPTPELLLVELNNLEMRLGSLEGTATEVRDIMLEVAGRSGHSGRLSQLEQTLREQREGQGKRLGALENDMAALKATRAQLRILGALGMLVLGALVGAIVQKFVF